MPPNKKLWSDEQIFSALRSFFAEHGRAPTHAEWSKAGYEHPAANTLSRRFGSWRKAIIAAGLPALAPGHKPMEWTAKRAVQAIYEFRFAHGRLPTRRDWEHPFRDRRYPHTSTVKRIFGSWNLGLIAAGYTPTEVHPLREAA